MSLESRIGEQIIPPEIMKKITAVMKRELAMNWQSDDDVIDSFSRIASIAFLEGGAAMLPESSAASETQPQLAHVWAVESKTTFALFASEDGARSYVSSFPPSVGGGMGIAKMVVLK